MMTVGSLASLASLALLLGALSARFSAEEAE